MTGEGAETGSRYHTGAYCPPARRNGPSWAGVGFAAAVLAVMVAAITVWIVHLRASAAQVPLVTYVAPQAVAPGTGEGADAAGPAGGTSAGGGSAGSSAAASSSPLDRVDHAWAARAAAATGISDRAFLAYASADLTIEANQPACGLGWNTLAAIGTVESANGTYGGATVLANGYTTAGWTVTPAGIVRSAPSSSSPPPGPNGVPTATATASPARIRSTTRPWQRRGICARRGR